MKKALLLTLLACTTLLISAQSRNAKYDAYINTYAKLAMDKQKQHKIPASITLAQGLLESGAGESKLAKQSNNHFGIKCGSSWSGKKVYHDDDKKGECFRSYSKVADSFDDHSDFLKRQRYTFLFDYDILDYKSWAYGLSRAGYATDPNYQKKLINIIETYELYKYDAEAAGRTDLTVVPVEEVVESRSANEQLFGYVVIDNNGRRCVRVITDDTMRKVAKEMNISLKMLLYYNDMPRAMALHSGDYVYLQPKRNQAAPEFTTHTVRAGESMHSISQQYGIKLKKLYKLNDMTYGAPAETDKVLKLRK